MIKQIVIRLDVGTDQSIHPDKLDNEADLYEAVEQYLHELIQNG